ncbi:glycosyl transferase [Amycolatopsis mediterranei S699]|uniref:dolichyl-phosphate beta-glucosyltransferase n=3 Tax=Amycolatopsis mediterranei TaxID=33910 RepID=A0A0H3D8V1_AMYMU|nr:glycosyltransferase [Amycolatopsis mediterranei]ADJ47420.1 glycosyltransferase [Amycolatopsis mediterranei U32]AEK44266.1 glycosyl transferase [Amycolatopsis mediterranei S699]AFO79131.1 glycosyl transferase [Amycolatopsis mediterranei S699]AGT86259.1 glycosyl transferase [Amycolatopsis mediterranei RB]KDO12654.1 sugar translocase [Amycolatopsis mediterranei]
MPGSTTRGPATEHPTEPLRTATVDIVIPVYNEQRALPGCVRVLHEFLIAQFPFSWKIVVVDNASTDGTLGVARALAEEFDRVEVRHLDRKGRGRALRESWRTSTADIVGYMDVDLSTGLNALLPLVAPLVNGHSDLAVGSRLAPGARTVRGAKREFISRSYNGIIRLTHGARFSDAQCGFKAARTDVIRPLLDRVADDSWFFDTELLLVAEHNGLRVHEVPVDWVEDTDTRVDVAGTALDDIRGLIRVARAKASGAARVPDLPRRPEPRAAHPDAVLGRSGGALSWQVLSFAVIGVLSTAANLALYGVFRTWWPALLANLAALVLTTLFNTEANRRFTFTSAAKSRGRIHLQGLAVFGLYYAFTSAALLALDRIEPNPARWLELVVLLVASVLGTAGRFLLLRAWVFHTDNGKDKSK